MKSFLFFLGLLSFYLSSCSPRSLTNHDPLSNASEKGKTSEIDKLIAQHDRDMDPQNDEHQAFKCVLQSLKNGTMGINDAFTRLDANGGKKCQAQYTWNTNKPKDWQTFLIHIVEPRCTPGNHIPYFEYAKANNADFKIWDMYGRSLLHLILWSSEPNTEQDLAWVLENTDVKDLINESQRKEGDPTQKRRGVDSGPLQAVRGRPNLEKILKDHGAK